MRLSGRILVSQDKTAVTRVFWIVRGSQTLWGNRFQASQAITSRTLGLGPQMHRDGRKLRNCSIIREQEVSCAATQTSLPLGERRSFEALIPREIRKSSWKLQTTTPQTRVEA